MPRPPPWNLLFKYYYFLFWLKHNWMLGMCVCGYLCSQHWRLTVNCCLLIRFKTKPNLRNFPIAKSKVTHREQSAKRKSHLHLRKLFWKICLACCCCPLLCLASGYNAQNERQTATAARQSKPGKLAYDQADPDPDPVPDPSQSQSQG